MDKFEYKVRADEIKELISRGEYAQAAEIADTIDWRRVKSVMMLCTISDLYKINRRYEDARDMLLLAYERRPGGRTICYSLCELSIKMGEYVQAVEYYKEFVQVAPNDAGRYILQYRLYEAQEVSLEERIAVLEELKKRDYREKWAYELAYLYHRVGLASRCVEECDELILWFGEGKYVVKAMELKMLHQPLTREQQLKYDNRFAENQEQEATGEAYAEDAYGQDSTASEQYSDMTGQEQAYEPAASVVQEKMESQQAVSEEASDELDIQVKTMDMGLCNTINLQAELAAGLKEVLSEDAVTRSIVAPMLDTDTESLDYPQIDEVSEDDLEEVSEEMESTEVFFGETVDMAEVQQEVILPEETEVAEEQQETPGVVPDVTAELVMQQLREEISGEAPVVLHTEPPKELAGVLSQESDGQLSLVMPERENVEKQITGQMNIEDILAEWERIKKVNQEKREAELRQHVLQQTGSMFTEFEAAVRDGLLEKLEREKNETEEAVVEEAVEEEPAEEAAEEVAEAEEAIVEEPAEEAAEEVAEAEEAVEEEPVEEAAEEVAEAEEAVEEEPAEEAAEEVIEAEEAAVEEPAEEIVRDQPHVRALTREEKELFGPYIQSRSAKEQLVKCIDSISMAAYTGNVIITGAEGMDTLTLAKNIIHEIQTADSNFSGKVAKISGAALNHKDVPETIERLKNGALIISKASEMDDDTVDKLYKALQQESLGIIIVLEDIRKAMDKFLAEKEQLLDCFTARMDVAPLSNDTLVAFGRQYAKEKEYSIDELGVLALHTRIEELQTIDHVVTVIEVKEIVDEAIRHVKRKNLRHFFDVLLGKRYDDEDMIILSEKDFV